jgi:hypothetical protein
VYTNANEFLHMNTICSKYNYRCDETCPVYFFLPEPLHSLVQKHGATFMWQLQVKAKDTDESKACTECCMRTKYGNHL